MEQKILIFKLLVIFCLCLYSFNSFSKEKILGKAIIIDGDTIHIGKNKIRLHGIDAPEYRQTCTIDKEIWNCGIESKIALENFRQRKKMFAQQEDEWNSIKNKVEELNILKDEMMEIKNLLRQLLSKKEL